jgi:hypothetical protein
MKGLLQRVDQVKEMQPEIASKVKIDPIHSDCKQMIMNLRKEKQNYYAKRSKRWIYCAVYAIIFGALAYSACYLLQVSTKAQFDRQILDSKLLDIMGNYNVKDALSDEVFLVSYSYNF